MREEIVSVGKAILGGRPVPPANLHLTLAFIGSVDASTEASYLEALEGLKPPTVELALDKIGVWAKPRILWLAPNVIPSELGNLVDDINTRLEACGFVPETRKYSPHVTLARKFSEAPLVDHSESAVLWTCKRVALAESVSSGNGVHYLPYRFWGDE